MLFSSSSLYNFRHCCFHHPASTLQRTIISSIQLLFKQRSFSSFSLYLSYGFFIIQLVFKLCCFHKCIMVKGLFIKYVTLEGEGVREGVTVCDRGRGVKSM